MQGTTIVNLAWLGTGVFLAAAVPTVLAPDTLATSFAALSAALFVVGCTAFLWSYGKAVSRSRLEAISIAGLYFLSGSAPKEVRRGLLIPLGLQILGAVAAASIRPYTPVAFGILCPVYGLGLAGLWGARHGTFPPREK